MASAKHRNPRLTYRLRIYRNMFSEADYLGAASILDAYAVLINKPAEERESIIKGIREAQK